MHSGRIVGYSIDTRMKASLTVAALSNAVRGNGETNIPRATRRANRPHDLITTVTSSYPTTQ